MANRRREKKNSHLVMVENEQMKTIRGKGTGRRYMTVIVYNM